MKNQSIATHFSIPHQFSNSNTAAPTNCNQFYFIPISEKAYELRPPSSTATTTKYPPPSAISTKTWTLQGYQHLIALTDILPHLPLHLKRLNPYSHTSVASTAPTIA
jgi:hypothetical protein